MSHRKRVSMSQFSVNLGSTLRVHYLRYYVNAKCMADLLLRLPQIVQTLVQSIGVTEVTPMLP